MTGAEAHIVCQLPGGRLTTEGVRVTEVELVPLSGQEEEFLALHLANGTAKPMAMRTTQVLSRCVKRLGNETSITGALIRQLLIPDRLFLLLKLREISFGNRVEGVVVCPWPQCGSKIDIDFSIQDVPIKPCETLQERYELTLSPEAAPSSDKANVVTYRLPTGADQEILAPVLSQNPAFALTRLLELCLAETGEHTDEVAQRVAELSPLARKEIEDAMEMNAPAVDLDMDLKCPDCGRGFTIPFDLQDFFFGELRVTRDMLYRQVHYLAYHYHWSEKEIMDMPRDKRLKYIEILADEIEALNDAV